MIVRVTLFYLGFAVLSVPLQSADDDGKSRMRDVLKARIAEDAKKAETKKSATGAKPAKSTSDGPAGESAKTGTTAPPAPDAMATAAKPSQPKVAETPTMLPKVEVRKGRITELDQKLAQQEQAIARERKNLQASEVDTALNDAKLARPLSIFGGESTQFRKRVASERVELMEAEKDLIEAIARSKTKKEKQELQKELDELKAVRRELEKSLR